MIPFYRTPTRPHIRIFKEKLLLSYCTFPQNPRFDWLPSADYGGEYESSTHSLNLAVEAADGGGKGDRLVKM